MPSKNSEHQELSLDSKSMTNARGIMTSGQRAAEGFLSNDAVMKNAAKSLNITPDPASTKSGADSSQSLRMHKVIVKGKE